MKKRFAVMGFPIEHSLSPMIHQHFAQQFGFEIEYDKIAVRAPDLEKNINQFFARGGMGLNITSPCKPEAFKLSASRSERVLEVQAANTLWIRNGLLHADNTDGVGFVRDFARFTSLTGKRVLILGAGGVVQGLLPVILAELPQKVVLFNRSAQKVQALQQQYPFLNAYNEEAMQSPFEVVINTTSALHDDLRRLMVPISLDKHVFCYDVVYNHLAPTPFLQWAFEQGYQGVDGRGMLVEQAAEAFYLWHGLKPDTSRVLKRLNV